MIRIDSQLLDKASAQAKTSQRRRMNFNFHKEYSDTLQWMLIALEPYIVVYEVKDGPYTTIDDKNFAPWAPKEGDAGAEEYLKETLKKMRIQQ